MYRKVDVQNLEYSVLHGFAVVSGAIIINTSGLKEFMNLRNIDIVPEEGRFAGLFKVDNKVIAKADIHGQEIIYVYKNEDDWAISNSFLLLASYASTIGKLSFYEPAVLNFKLKSGTHMGEQLISRKTMIKEIQILPVNSELHFDLETGELKEVTTPIKKLFDIHELNYQETIISMLSEGRGIIKALNEAGIPLELKLSGGYDSRLVLGMLTANQGKPLTNVYISSDENRKADFEIAKSLCKKLDLPLNTYTHPHRKRTRFVAEDSFRFFMLACCGSYLPAYPVNDSYLSDKFVLRLTGDYSADASHFRGNAIFNGDMVKVAGDISKTLTAYKSQESVLADFKSNFDILGVAIDDPLAPPLYYLSNRARHHCGRQWYKSLGVSCLITPLMSKHFTKLNLYSYLNFGSEDKLFTDIFSAFGEWAVETPFESAKGSLNPELVKSSSFKGGIALKDIEYEVYGSFTFKEPDIESFKSNLPINGRVQVGDFENKLVSTFKKIDISKYKDIFNEQDFNLMYMEIGKEARASHGYRRLTHMIYVDTIKNLTN